MMSEIPISYFSNYMDNLENVPSFLDFLLGVLVNNTWLGSVFLLIFNLAVCIKPASAGIPLRVGK